MKQNNIEQSCFKCYKLIQFKICINKKIANVQNL